MNLRVGGLIAEAFALMIYGLLLVCPALPVIPLASQLNVIHTSASLVIGLILFLSGICGAAMPTCFWREDRLELYYKWSWPYIFIPLVALLSLVVLALFFKFQGSPSFWLVTAIICAFLTIMIWIARYKAFQKISNAPREISDSKCPSSCANEASNE